MRDVFLSLLLLLLLLLLLDCDHAIDRSEAARKVAALQQPTV